MNRHIFVLFLSIFYLTAKAQEGKSAFDFLNLPISSHINALGGNNISIIEEDVSVIQHNPALLGPEMNLQLNLNYMRYVAGINLAGATFAKAAGERGAWAAAIQYAGYGSMKQVEANGVITGTFSPKDMSISGFYAHDITDRLRGGIQAKFLYSSYEQYTSLALAIDLGINYYNPDNQLSLSIAFKNLGGQLKKYNENRDKMPWDIQLGLSKTLDHAPFRFSITAQHLSRWKLPYTAPTTGEYNSSEDEIKEKGNFATDLFRHLVFGIDYIPSRNLYIALGYNYKYRSDMQTYGRNFLSGFTVGAGIKVKMFGIGASLAQQHVGGTTLMFNLTTNISQFIQH